MSSMLLVKKIEAGTPTSIANLDNASIETTR
jgi:hypothetical protein